MDEPFGALDAQTRAQMQTHLMEIWRNVDITVLFITHDLDEAVLLADRILVLKANPGEVQEIIEVPVPRPRDFSQLNSPEFQATRRRLDELIHPKPATPLTAGIEHLPIIRLTQAGDDVE
jgi:NitT/TauT family transport system ATP-binding protein